MYTTSEIQDGSAVQGQSMVSNGIETLSSTDEDEIWEWNRDVPEVVSTCIHSLVSSQSLSHPSLPAVCSWDGNFTYGELEDLSSTLAIYLGTQGVGLEDFVPLCFEKSKWTIVSMLAVLKAGAAFVPIDPGQPRNRISHVVGQTRARLVLSSQDYAETCSAMVELVFVVDEKNMAALTKGQPSSSSVSAHNAAYCIFTSGSTGPPKGVVVEHEQLSTYSVIGGKAMGFESKPRVLQFASYTFDASLIEIFNTLVFGGCVCIPSDWERMNDIIQAMGRMRVTYAVFSPSLLSNISLDNLETLTTVILGAEKIPPTLVQRLSPKLKVWPTYGPTETCCVCLKVDTSRSAFGVGDIGRAMTARPWIVEVGNINKLAAIGSVGELLLEGPVVARGYLNNVDKSTEAFIQPPQWMLSRTKQPPYRFYRSGDLAKYNNDGSIKFLGRMDNQVKIRGQRLELGEVEHYMQKSLANAATVKEIVVELIVPFGENSSPILAAFLRLDPNHIDTFGYLNWQENCPSTLVTPGMEMQNLAKLVSEVKAELGKFLPTYAIPSIYIPVKRVPLSTALKVDRKSLRAMAREFSAAQLFGLSATSQSATSFLHVSSTERRLRSLWAKVLNIDPSTITMTDNFFWMGGDSVSAIGLAAAARSEGLFVTVGDILKRPVLSHMASAVTSVDSHPEPDIQPFSLVDYNLVDRLRDTACKECKVKEEYIEDIYPCSPMQRGLLTLSVTQPGSYVIQSVFSLPSSLDVEKFKTAWQTIVSNNPILRTRFFEYESEGLFQVVLKGPIIWQHTRETSIDSFLAEDKKATMDTGCPMSRFALVESSGYGFQFIWTVHHSLIDGWSTAQVLKCVEQAYVGLPSAPATPYKNFIRYLSSIDAASSKSFWDRQLIDSPVPSFPHLPSPTYRPIGNATQQLQVSLSRQSRSSVTTATIIQTAWALLIGLYSNTSDVITGMTLNGRTAPFTGVEKLIGPTLVTIPCRMQFRRDQLISDLLETIQQQYVEMIPFEQFSLTAMKQIGAHARTACDFQTLLVVQYTGEKRPESRPLFSSAPNVFLSMDYALALECELTSRSGTLTKVQLKATYDPHLLSGVEIRRFLNQFEHILRQLCIESPSSRVADLQALSLSDAKQIFSWNATVPQPYEYCVHDLIEKRTLMNRDHPAICSWDGEFTYGELDDLSSQLSSYLITYESIGPEILVPVCFEKSKWAVVAMLAILKAGGGCVPLSPAHPVSRLKTVVEDLGPRCARIALTSVSSEHLFNGMLSTLNINLSLFSSNLINGSSPSTKSPSGKTAAPNNVAFIVTTSGSTGKPKEIVLEHSSICTSARDHGKMIKLDRQSRVLQFAAYTFDISIGDIFVTLIHGGCICIPSEHDRMNDLAGAIQSMNVNHASLTTAVASHLYPQDLESLRVLVVAGEAMTREVVDRWAEHVSLINMYGPAECSIYCIGQPDIQWNDHASVIGKGVGSRVWITSEEDPNVLVPIGAVGELLIEGPVLARGYLNDEAQTKSPFIYDPSWIQAEASYKSCSRRFYRTGDLGRYTTDGLISFVGRKDDGQIKLRGQRVETDEVAYQLRACLSKPVESVVSVINVNGQAKLAAFLEMETDMSLANFNGDGDGTQASLVPARIADSTAQLGQFKSMTSGIEQKLASVLPGYMVPSLFIPVSNIPLSMSGKVDRKKLNLLVAQFSIDQLSSFRGSGSISRPPSTVMERRLAALWESLLKVTAIGIDDNFFQRGGDSIGAMRLVAAARQVKLSITVDTIFKNPTLSEMALVVRDDVKEVSGIPPYSLLKTAEAGNIYEEAMSQCKVLKEEIEDIYPCTPQQIYWINGGINTQEHQAQCVYDIPASLDLERFRGAWNSVATSHDILRTRIISTLSGYFNVVLKTGLEWRTESSLEAYLKEDRVAIMGFGDRLQRFCIVNDGYLERQFFVFTAQHSSYDAWSLYLLTKDRDHAYHHGVSAAAGPNFNQYIKPIIQDSYKSAAGAFWQSHLARTKSKPLIVVPEGHCVFPDSMFKRDFKLLKRHGSTVTTSTMIEVAWAIVFSRFIQQADVVLDVLRHGRNAPLPGVMDLIAPTITAVPFFIRVDPGEMTLDLLQRAQDQLSNMDAFEHMGFDNISKLSPEVALACKNSIRIHILPPLNDLQQDGGIVKGIDLPTRWVELCLALPFRVDCVVTKDGIGVEATFDKDLISPDQVNTFFDQFQSVIMQLALAEAGQKIGDVMLSGISDHESVLMESIESRSAEVKKAMLVSVPSLLS
jgi:amino acid adenylation domain-containing protein